MSDTLYKGRDLAESDGVYKCSTQTKLTAAYGATSDYFGYSVGISGNFAIVGAHLDDDKGNDSGAAYIFELNKSTGIWIQRDKLTAADATAGDYFGWSVSISGKFAVVGAHLDDDNGNNSGAAYVFELDESSGTWIQKAKLTAADAAAYDYFGSSVGISGNVVVVGAYGEDEKGNDSGSAYIFQLNESTGVWNQKAKLTAADGGVSDNVGNSVGISGSIVVVGAHLDDDNGSNSGAAYVFELNEGTGVWNQKAKLTAADGATGDYFGWSVGVSGNVVIIGAYLDDDKGSDSGSAYIFNLNESTGIWSQKAKLTAVDADTYDYFGYSVSISGNVVVVGAYADDDKGSQSGAAYVFSGTLSKSIVKRMI
ncbi:hypothetical protein ACHAWX_003022 [Stephanocyclus meneghinianus]